MCMIIYNQRYSNIIFQLLLDILFIRVLFIIIIIIQCYLIIFHDHNRLKLREDKRPVINESIIFNSPGTAHFGENIGNMPAPDLCRQFE